MDAVTSLAHTKLLQLLRERHARVVVLGLGHVGWPQAAALAAAGFSVCGVEPARARRAALVALQDFGLVEVVPNAAAVAGKVDVVLLCVPTPLPNARAQLDAATQDAARLLHHGGLVVVISTVTPGTTGDLWEKYFKNPAPGAHVWMACSPERLDPGTPGRGLGDIPRVVGGLDAQGGDLAACLYAAVAPQVVRVSHARVAEMSKLVENTFRAVNVALAAELRNVCNALGVDAQETLAAAATKPFGYMPFIPGVGCGGPCVPTAVQLVRHAAVPQGARTPVLDAVAAHQAHAAPTLVAHVVGRLENDGVEIPRARVLVAGVGYKPGSVDTRGSVGLEVARLLALAGAQVCVADSQRVDTPFVQVPWNAGELLQQDAVVVVSETWGMSARDARRLGAARVVDGVWGEDGVAAVLRAKNEPWRTTQTPHPSLFFFDG